MDLRNFCRRAQTADEHSPVFINLTFSLNILTFDPDQAAIPKFTFACKSADTHILHLLRKLCSGVILGLAANINESRS